MKQVHIGIGEYAISNDPEELLKSFALGSCVAIMVYDMENRIAALAHIALPDSSVNMAKGDHKPGYFVDTCLPKLLGELKKRGAVRKKAWIKLAGGANTMDEQRTFDIGKRNVLAIKKYLWKMQLGTIAEDVGGSVSRTVSFSVGTGEVNVTSGGDKWSV